MTTREKSPPRPEIPEPDLDLKALPPIDATAFRDLLGKSWIARELLLPQGRAAWDGERYSFGRAEHGALIPTVSGVRFQEPDPHRIDENRERGCQADLVALVGTVIELRKNPQLGHLVLGLNKDVAIGAQAGNSRCKRGLFGLCCPVGPRFENDVEAAAFCHQQIVRAGKKASFTLREEVPDFDPRTGMKGLHEWAGRVRWKRAWRPPWWLLGFLPLLFLPIWCNGPATPKLFGVDIDTDSVEIVVDNSPSMSEIIHEVPGEVKKFVAAFRRKHPVPYGNVITYAKEPESALGGIKPLSDKKNVDTLGEKLDDLKAVEDDGTDQTDLDKALELAAKEIAEHGRKTTIVIFTDGIDNHLPAIQRKVDGLCHKCKGNLQGVRFVLMPPKTDRAKSDHKTIAKMQDEFNRKVNPAGALPGVVMFPGAGGGGGAGPGGGPPGGGRGGSGGPVAGGGDGPNGGGAPMAPKSNPKKPADPR